VLERGEPLLYTDQEAERTWLKIKFPLPDPRGGVGVAGIGLDITERTRLEQALAESERRSRALVGRLIDAQESERRRLADELHDLIGQNLTALGIDLAALRARLPDSGDAARLEAMRALVEGTIGSIRGVMTGLRPPALEEFGLVPALRAYAAEFAQRTGMAVEVQAAAGEARLAEGAELALFRIAQEALTNAAKHSGGKSVRIRFATGDGGIRLSIEDDGAGFDQPGGARAARRGGWGLPEMRERAEAHAGSLLVDTAAGGTRVTVEIPIKVS
jgi:signal transduction histidine kinase